ncbi:MAG: DNA-processing protein DprA, partial [Candidatus Brocadiales bacterium]
MDAELHGLLRLNLARGIGPTTCRHLLERFGSAQAALQAQERELLECGLNRQQIKSLHYSEADVERELRLAEEHGIKLLPWNDKDYPHNLKFIYDPPPVLYVKGEIRPQDALSMAIVGSRLCTYYGQSQAERFAGVLGRTGFTIVSGLARGIDTSAHSGALKAGARTIAVMGCGLARIYPRENSELAEKISKAGAIVSELPML